MHQEVVGAQTLLLQKMIQRPLILLGIMDGQPFIMGGKPKAAGKFQILLHNVGPPVRYADHLVVDPPLPPKGLVPPV
jgi:hypothetical protein